MFNTFTAENTKPATMEALQNGSKNAPKNIKSPEAKALLEKQKAVVILDVRTPEEFAAGHLPGFRNTPGGQLVQETDHTAAVRGAVIVRSIRSSRSGASSVSDSASTTR